MRLLLILSLLWPLIVPTEVESEHSKSLERNNSIDSVIDKILDPIETEGIFTIFREPKEGDPLFESIRSSNFSGVTEKEVKERFHAKYDFIKKKVEKGVNSFFDTILDVFHGGYKLTGKHICTRELTKTIEINEEMTERRSSHRKCQHFQKGIRCVEREKGDKQTIQIQECCVGYDTNHIEYEGCDKEISQQSTRTVLSQANSSFADLLDSLGLSDVLEGVSKYTIIVPPNAAIDKIKRLSRSEQRRIVLNHILRGDVRDYDMMEGSELISMANASLSILQSTVEAAFQFPTTIVNCIPFSITDVYTTTGTIHYASDSISPSDISIFEYMERTGRFKTFLSLLTPDLEQKLRDGNDTFGKYTVFAFSDDVFAELHETVRAAILSESSCVNGFILNHIVDGAFCSFQVNGRRMRSLGDYDLPVFNQESKESAHIIESDRFASNGVVHAIDRAILPETLFPWQSRVAQHNQFLLEALSTEIFPKPLTVFVPLNDTKSVDTKTFSIPDSKIDADQDPQNMKDIALNHVFVNSLVLHPYQKRTVTASSGSKYFIGLYDEVEPELLHDNFIPTKFLPKPMIGCSRILQTFLACDSIIHLIAKPLPTINGDLEWFFKTRKDLKRFHTLWKASDVEHLLETTSPITVFAPSDEAMSLNQYNALLNDKKMLNKFVRRCMAKIPYCSSDLQVYDSESIRYALFLNEAGETLESETIDRALHINGARVQEEEILLSNGVVYVLETPILTNQELSEKRESMRWGAFLKKAMQSK